MKRSRSRVVLVGVSVAVGISFWLAGTPQYSLYQFRTAIMSRDDESARRFIDIEGVVDSMVASVTGPEGPPDEAASRDGAAGESAGGVMAFVTPAVKESMRKQLRVALTRPSEDTTVIRKITSTRLADFVVRREGSTALVSVRDDPRVVFRMRRSGWSWRIVQIMMESLVYHPAPRSRPAG